MKRYDIAIAACVLLLTFAAIDIAAQPGRKSVSTAEVTGTFRMKFGGKFRDMSNDIKIASAGRGKIRVAMDLVFPYTLKNGDPMVNMGSLDEDFDIARDTA